MKQFKIVLVALLGLILTGCYNDFEMPSAPIQYEDDAAFEKANPDLEHISIADLKAIFGNISNTGTNNSQGTTKYIRFVADKSECNAWELEKSWYNTGNYYIKGKVISNDEQGNIYKSLHIFDGTAAIELKLTNGLFLDYPCNLETGETTWVYVKVRGLYLGNFRMMLSLGDIPTSNFNAWGTYKYYANSNIVSPIKVRQHVFLGKSDVLTRGTSADSDIYEVDATNFKNIHGSNTAKFLGRLIYFKGLRVHYAGVAYPNENGETVTDPALMNGSLENIYPSWICTSGIQTSLPIVAGGTPTQVVNQPWYTLAYSRNNVALYGSVCLSFIDNPQYTSEHGVYMLRTSGYSRFSGNYIPKNGVVGNVLAIYQIYSQQSSYAGDADDWATYQISISRIEDFEFETAPKQESAEWSAHIKWAEDNFPQYVYPVTPDIAAREAAVAEWKATYNATKPENDGSELWTKWNAWGDWVMWILENTPEYSYLLPQQIVEDTETIE